MLPILVEVACLAAIAAGVALISLPIGIIVAGALGVAVIERR